jgi:N-acetyl-gamma-glutamylphosphate reductase
MKKKRKDIHEKEKKYNAADLVILCLPDNASIELFIFNNVGWLLDSSIRYT